MQVRVKFHPEIMKMGLSVNMQVSEEDGLEEMKSKTLSVFWEFFPILYENSYGKALAVPKHGTTKNVELLNEKFELIITNEEFQSVSCTGKIYARFKHE